MATSSDPPAPNWQLGRVFRKSDWRVVAALLVIMAILAEARTTHYLFFHTMAELFAIVVSFSIFVLAWSSRHYLANGYLIVLGGSYGAVALVDVFHALTFKGMNLFPGVSTNYPTQFWLTARFLEALALLLAPFLISRKPGFHAVSLSFTGAALLACAAVMAQWFPAAFVDGVGLTVFKVYAEYLIIAMLLVGLVMLYRHRDKFEPRIFFLLTTSLLLAVATEFCFTRVYDFTNELGHYLRFLSVALAFMAIVISGVRQPFELIFRESEQHKRELDALNARLLDSEDQLKRAQRVARVGSWYLDAVTKALSWSDETYRMFGVPPGTTQSLETFANYIHPQDRKAVLAAWNQALQGKRPYDIEHRIVVGDEVRWVREVAELTFAQDGTPLAGLGAVQDITERKLAQDLVRESQERYRLLFEMSADAIMLTAPDGRIFQANPAACHMFGRSEEEICRLGRSGVVDTADPRLAAALEARRRTGKFGGEIQFVRKDGSKFLGEVTTSIFNDKSGKERTSMIIRDITERKRIEVALKESEARMSAVFQASPLGIVISRLADGMLLEVNDETLRLFGFSREQAIGKRTVVDLGTYAKPTQREEMVQRLRQHGMVHNYPMDFLTHDGRQITLEVSGRVIELHGEVCLLAMMVDVTDRKKAEAVIEEQAFHDALTQLPNRRLLDNRLQQAMAAAKRSGNYAALMFIDLDNFKPLNDTHGHDVGDLLLIEASARLKSCVREVDTVARVGGDEFVLMLSELNADLDESTAQTAAVAEKVRTALANPYFLTLQRDGPADSTVEHRCSASIGVALFVNDEVSQDDILNRADVAMYQAKHAGRNLVRFYAST